MRRQTYDYLQSRRTYQHLSHYQLSVSISKPGCSKITPGHHHLNPQLLFNLELALLLKHHWLIYWLTVEPVIKRGVFGHEAADISLCCRSRRHCHWLSRGVDRAVERVTPIGRTGAVSANVTTNHSRRTWRHVTFHALRVTPRVYNTTLLCGRPDKPQ